MIDVDFSLNVVSI